jgi:hypothetical protein
MGAVDARLRLGLGFLSTAASIAGLSSLAVRANGDELIASC